MRLALMAVAAVLLGVSLLFAGDEKPAKVLQRGEKVQGKIHAIDSKGKTLTVRTPRGLVHTKVKAELKVRQGDKGQYVAESLVQPRLLLEEIAVVVLFAANGDVLVTVPSEPIF